MSGGRINLPREQWETVLAAAEERLRFPEYLRRQVWVGGRDLSHRVDSFGYGKGDGLACVLEMVLSEALPEGDEGKPVRVFYLVSPPGRPAARVLAYSGKLVKRRVRGSYTEVTAGTGGYEAARTPIGRGEADDREYVGATPSGVLYDMLSIIAREYEGIEIPRQGEPRIYAADSAAVRWTGFVLSGVGMVQEQASLIAADTPTNVAGAYFSGALSADEGEVWRFEEGRDTENGGVEVDTGDEERYASVIVWRAIEGGRHIPLTDPIKVDNHGVYVNPRSCYPVELTDEMAAQGERPYNVGMREAMRLSQNKVRVTVKARYPTFFLARGDVVGAVKREQLEEGVRVTEYRVRVDANPIEGAAGSPTGEAEFVREGFEPRPAPVFYRRPDTARPLRGRQADGVPYLSLDLPYVLGREPPEAGGAGVLVVSQAAAERYGVKIRRVGGTGRVVSVRDG